MQQKIPKKTGFLQYAARGSVLTVACVATLGMTLVPTAGADRFDDQINQLQQQNSSVQGSLDDLQAQASSYQDAITRLQSQISDLQQQITDNLAQQAKLQQQIIDNQNELARQRDLLRNDIKTMYVDGEPTTLEMLASSGSLSDFVDKQQYRTSVQDKIQATLQKIKDLQQQLGKQKTAVDQLLQDQRLQQGQLAGARNQQADLLAKNQDQQDQYNQQIKDNKAKITDLRAQQAAENAKLLNNGARYLAGTSCDTSAGDTYPQPWCSATQDSQLDSWGMLNRECVSYAAWKVHESGRTMPFWGGVGNANQWPGDASAAGIPVDGNPKPGDVAISMRGGYGHAMYVESVNSNGTINISQYNFDLAGHFSRMNGVSASGLLFIHFP